MYKIKQKPEDFIVNEISTVKAEDKGKYAYFILKKKNYDTLKALQVICKKLGLHLKKTGFAGNKDKIAITTQVCSAETSPERLEKLELKDIEITVIGRGNEPVSLGDLKGNEFEITVRNIEKLPEPKNKFVNFFGEQRFSRINADVGKAIVKRDFKKAAELLELNTEGNNYLATLKTIPVKMLRFYIHAYQSRIWNRLAEQSRKNTLPIVGFATKPSEKLQNILDEERINVRDFIIREFPELSSEGTERKVFAEAKDLEIGKPEDDELNRGKKKFLLKFTLKPGSYATEYVRQLFQEQSRCH